MESCTILSLGPDPPPLHLVAGKASIAWAPIIRVEPVPQCSTRLLGFLSICDWVVFTSPRGPRLLYMDAVGRGVEEELRKALARRRVAVVGPSTASSLEEFFGIEPSLVPREYSGAALGEELVAHRPRCVVLARSRRGVKDLPRVLARNRIPFQEIPVYDEKPNIKAIPFLPELASRAKVVLLTSPFIAELYCKYIEPAAKPQPVVVSIGPSTLSVAVKKCSGRVLEELPPEYTYREAISLALRTCRDTTS